jgi:hypothetical protein
LKELIGCSKEIEGEAYEAILSRLKDKQYDTSRLIKTPQK